MPLLPTEGEGLGPQGPLRRPWHPSDPRQIETRRRLRLFGDAPADHFLDACELMEKDELRATTHLVAHSLRELDGGIRAVLVAGLDEERLARVAAAERKHKAEIEGVSLMLFGDGEQIAGDCWRYASRLHELTHRHSLRAPRPADDAFVTGSHLDSGHPPRQPPVRDGLRRGSDADRRAGGEGGTGPPPT